MDQNGDEIPFAFSPHLQNEKGRGEGNTFSEPPAAGEKPFSW